MRFNSRRWRANDLAARSQNVHSRPSSDRLLGAGASSGRSASIIPLIGEQRPVKILPYRSLTVIAAATLWALPAAMAAQAPNPHDSNARSATPAGSYLAGRQAHLGRDVDGDAS